MFLEKRNMKENLENKLRKKREKKRKMKEMKKWKNKWKIEKKRIKKNFKKMKKYEKYENRNKKEKNIWNCNPPKNWENKISKKSVFCLVLSLVHWVMVSTWWWLLSCSNNYPPQNKLDNCSHFNSLIHYTSFRRDSKLSETPEIKFHHVKLLKTSKGQKNEPPKL